MNTQLLIDTVGRLKAVINDYSQRRITEQELDAFARDILNNSDWYNLEQINLANKIRGAK